MYYYTSVKMFPIWRSEDKIAIFHGLWINNFPENNLWQFPVRKISRALWRQFWFPVNWLVGGIFSVCYAEKFHYKIWVFKTLVQSTDISIIEHLFTGCEWNTSLIQSSSETILSPRASPRGMIPASDWMQKLFHSQPLN